MSSESGELHVSHGVHYEEHHGVMAKLAFGQELAFCAGSEMKVLAGMESSFVVGAENKVGVATNSIFELGAEVKYVRGWAVEIAHEGGGAYEHAFTATAGSSKLGAFRSLQIFMGFSVLAQAAAVATMLLVVKSNYVKDGKLTPTGESGAKTTLAICQNVAGVVMFLGTMALNAVVRKFLHTEPLSAVTVNHESEAFIGVRGSSTHPGTGGLELLPNQFKLSAGNANRKFKTPAHEVIGFESDADTQIVGTQDKLEIKAHQVSIGATSTPGSIVLKDKLINAWAGGEAANPSTSFQMGTIELTSPKGKKAKATKGIRLSVSQAGTAISMAQGWLRMACNDGTMLELANNNLATLSFANSSASVLLKQTEASLNFGNQSVKISNTGVNIAGQLTILAPAVGVPNAEAKITVASELLGVIAANVKSQTESIVHEKTFQAVMSVYKRISEVKRQIETKISEALTKAGAV